MRTHCAFLRISGAQTAGAEVVEEEEEGMEVPKEVVEVLKNAQAKLQDCLDCVYEDRDLTNESDCLAADRTPTLAKLMYNNTVVHSLRTFMTLRIWTSSSGPIRQTNMTRTSSRLTTRIP